MARLSESEIQQSLRTLEGWQVKEKEMSWQVIVEWVDLEVSELTQKICILENNIQGALKGKPEVIKTAIVALLQNLGSGLNIDLIS